MKINPGFDKRCLVLAAAFLAALGCAAHATAQEQLTAYLVDLNAGVVTGLGTLGGSWSGARGINDAGQVTGSSATAGGYHAFITGPDGAGMRDLGTLRGSTSVANGINDAGRVVGWTRTADGFSSPFITGPDGTDMKAMSTIGWRSTVPHDINDAGRWQANSSRRAVNFMRSSPVLAKRE